MSRLISRILLTLLITNLSFFLVGLSATSNGKTIAPSTPVTSPNVVVAVQLDVPDFTLREFKYRVFYNKSEVKRIPLNDYDFKAAFTDELITALGEDKRMDWRKQSSDEVIDVSGLWDRKVQMPSVKADRILLAHIQEYGAYMADLAADKFYMVARFRLIDRVTGKKLWEKKLYERIDLTGKVAELQADNQKGLKEGINKVLEKLCGKIVAEIRNTKI